MIDPVFELSLRLALSLLFAVAAWHKVIDLHRFETAVRGYALLPPRMVPVASRLLPLAELVIALGLLHGETRRPAALAAVSILLFYTGAIGLNLVRGRRDIDCGCLTSSAQTPLSPWLVARNVGLAVAAGVTLWPSRQRPLLWVDGLTVASTLVALSLLWVAAQRLAQTGPALRKMRGHR